jgi:hypothetical protein
LIGLALLACHGGGPEPAGCDDAPTWDDFAHGYVQTWCQPCHSSLLTGADRQGAPAGVDFDTWSEVYAQRDRVQARAVDYLPSPMPPQGGVPEDDVARLGQWLACGAEGEDPPPGPCDQLVTAGATTVASQADADALCARANAVDALTVEATATVGCLCAVTGDLAVTGGAVDLPRLGSVGGAIALSGAAEALRAPVLGSVGGDLVAQGAPSLTEVSAPALVHLGGQLALTDLDALVTVDLSQLYDVGGALILQGDPALPSFGVPRLRAVGGDFALEDLAGLAVLDDTRSLESIAGSVRLRGLPELTVLDPWSFLVLTTVGGDVVVSGNDRLQAIHGFTSLGQDLDPTVDAPTFAGSVVIEDDRSLRQITGFDLLYRVGGDVRIRADAQLESVTGFVNLARVDGALVFEDLADATSLVGPEDLESAGELRIARVNEHSLADFPRLERVDTDLTIDGCRNLTEIRGLTSFTTVGRDLFLTGNTALGSIDGLQSVTTVGRDLHVEGNAALPTAVIDAWVGGVDVGGQVVVNGNG